MKNKTTFRRVTSLALVPLTAMPLYAQAPPGLSHYKDPLEDPQVQAVMARARTPDFEFQLQRCRIRSSTDGTKRLGQCLADSQGRMVAALVGNEAMVFKWPPGAARPTLAKTLTLPRSGDPARTLSFETLDAATRNRILDYVLPPKRTTSPPETQKRAPSRTASGTTPKSPSPGTRYQHDLENRLTRVEKPDGTVVQHSYDVDGNRVQTITTPPGGAPVVTNYLVDPSGPLSHVVAETDGTGALTSHYVRGDDLLSVMRPTGPDTWQSRFFHADGIGSVRRLTDEAGNTTDTYAYTAFGELMSHAGPDPQPYAFAGEPYDPNIGFQYHRARWMDPRVGRFTGTDPWEGAAYDPPTLHRYLYARIDPQNRLDPSGLAEFSIGGLAKAMAIGGTINAIASIGHDATIGSIAQAFAIGALEGAAFYAVGTVVIARIAAQTAKRARLLGPSALVRAPQFASKLEAFEHYSKHVKGVVQQGGGKVKVRVPDLPEFSSLDEYVEAGRTFLGGPPRGGVMQLIRENGDIVRLDPATGYFGVKSSGGVLRTFFRPDGGPKEWIEYFLKQL